MSKTKGNVVDPLGVIDETGADALRFALIHGSAAGQDQRFGTAKLENARNFANKLWNATRFVVGARPASIAAGRRSAPARRPPPRAGGALDPVACIGDGRGGRRRHGRLRVRRGDPRPVRRDLERVLRLGRGARQGPAGRRLAPRRGARGDLVDTRRGTRHVPAPAAPGHAVRDRGALGRDPAPGIGSGPAHRRPLARRRGARHRDRGPGIAP